MKPSSLLNVRDLSTYFYTQDGIVRAVNNVSFNVGPGETIALVGESGCGKTVSALSILRLIQDPPGKIMSGEVIWDKMDLLQVPSKTMQKIRGAQISMIFQEPMTSFNPVLTIGRQLSESLELHLKMSNKQALEEATRLLRLVGISEANKRLKDYPHNFSGGMKQRVMIAMAISCRPKLIIADEPTTAVDVTIQAQLLELIRKTITETKTALILITHNLGIVARYAERVYVMYAGEIVEHGLASDIFRSPYHPYTAGLLASIPRIDEPRKIRLIPIRGQPPDLLSPSTGCPFGSRCIYKIAECQAEKQELIEVTPAHYSTCWFVRSDIEQWQKRTSSR